MTMTLKKDFTSFNHRLFVVPASARAISFKSSPSGELSYYMKKRHTDKNTHVAPARQRKVHFTNFSYVNQKPGT